MSKATLLGAATASLLLGCGTLLASPKSNASGVEAKPNQKGKPAPQPCVAECNCAVTDAGFISAPAPTPTPAPAPIYVMPTVD